MKKSKARKAKQELRKYLVQIQNCMLVKKIHVISLMRDARRRLGKNMDMHAMYFQLFAISFFVASVKSIFQH